MDERARFNVKRRIVRHPPDAAQLSSLARRVRYEGSPLHKRNPGDFGLTPPAQPRLDKTLCDGVHVTSPIEALRLLRDGVQRGVFSEQRRGDFPQNVWAVMQDGTVLEAQQGSPGSGTYHGYPLAANDPFRAVVLRAWNRA